MDVFPRRARRFLSLFVVLSLMLSAHGLAPYGAAAQILTRASVETWKPAAEELALRLHVNPSLDPEGTLTRTLGQARIEIALNPSAAGALAFTSDLPAEFARNPSAFLLAAPEEQAKALKAAVAAAGERLEPRAAELAELAQTRKLAPAEEAEARALASSWFYLSPESAGRIRALSRQIEARRGLARRLAEALAGRKPNIPETPGSVAAAELGFFFAGAERLAAAHLVDASRGDFVDAQRSLVQTRLAPYADRFLAMAARRAVERRLPALLTSSSILSIHNRVFGGQESAGLRKLLRPLGIWTEFVSAASLAAMSAVLKETAPDVSGRLLALAGQDYNLDLAIPTWHPLASSYATVADALKDGREAPKDLVAKHGFPLFSAFGIEVRADPSLLFTVGLLSYQLATVALPLSAPGLGAPTYALMGFVCASALFASIAAHEFGHALVGRLFGVETRAIILHVIGGTAAIDREPRRAVPELLIAFAGPAVSACLTAAFLLGARLEPPTNVLAAVLSYLGVANAFVAVFNLMPAFPLDGGRILRAALAGIWQDHYRATKFAAEIGKGFGFLFMFCGIVQVMTVNFNGLFSILIGGLIQLGAGESAFHPGTQLVEPPTGPGLKGLPRNLNLGTVAKAFFAAPLLALCLPLGKIESALRSRYLLALYPGATVLGGGHSNIVLLAKTRKGTRVVVKEYGVTGTALTWLGRLTLPAPDPGDIHRYERFRSDRAASLDLQAAGIPAARIVSSDEATRTNVSTFVEGQPLVKLMKTNPTALLESGRSLRLAHDRGWAIIDNQPSNFVIGQDGRAYFIDLEHAHRDPEGRYRAWDVGVYLCWLKAAAADEAAAQQALKSFWIGYGDVSPKFSAQVDQVLEEMEIFIPFMKISSDDSEASSQ